MRRLVGGFLLAVAALLSFISLIAPVDPVGTQMANDADPFGPPPPWHVPAPMLAASLGLGWLSLWFPFARGRIGKAAASKLPLHASSCGAAPPGWDG